MININGWNLLFHPLLIEQIKKFDYAAQQASFNEDNAIVTLLKALSKLIYERIPLDPSAPEYRQGTTLGKDYRYWRRAKFCGRFRLYFRYDTNSKIIAYIWVNDSKSLRKAGSRTDPYALFQKMLGQGNPPDDMPTLMAACKTSWQ